MPHLSTIESAMKLGVSLELLEYFTRQCPKRGESRLLLAKEVSGEELFDENELLSYRDYLNEPWPHQEGKRPSIPRAIQDDIKQESHLACAICGHLDNGEVAHIVAVADSLNNSPDNLIFLCPNHHSKYDLGYKPASNVTLEVVQAAKTLKRNTRIRMMRYEANASTLCRAVVGLLKSLQQQLAEGTLPAEIAKVYEIETSSLMQTLPSLTTRVRKAASRDRASSDVDQLIASTAPTLARLSRGITAQTKQSKVRAAASTVVKTMDEALVDIDEVDCPRCDGRGLTGLVGDFCAFCHGDCFVSTKRAENYDPGSIDQVDCPRCGGKGMVGFGGAYCPFCHGSCSVSKEKADTFDEDNLSDEACPHCGGTGQRGLAGDLCSYCDGDTFVSPEKAKAYKPEALDEVKCPRCGGRGMTGLNQDFCAYCHGSQFVTREKEREYSPEDIDEVECPHCRGRGLVGRIGDLCSYCGGAQVVSPQRRTRYDPTTIDEVECPRCGGSGETGLRGSECRLCHGAGFVTEKKSQAYQKSL